MIVYHGSNVIVKHPDIEHSFRPLDFGKGSYPDYDRIAFISQKAINELLSYESFDEIYGV